MHSDTLAAKAPTQPSNCMSLSTTISLHNPPARRVPRRRCRRCPTCQSRLARNARRHAFVGELVPLARTDVHLRELQPPGPCAAARAPRGRTRSAASTYNLSRSCRLVKGAKFPTESWPERTTCAFSAASPWRAAVRQSHAWIIQRWRPGVLELTC
jgi:hypothetical protein